MGADFLAVCHPRREYILLGRPMRQGGILARDAEVLIYRWADTPVVFLTDQGSAQDTYMLIRTGDVETYGHLEGCPTRGWQFFSGRGDAPAPSCTCVYRQLNASSK